MLFNSRVESEFTPQACLVVLGGFFALFATVGINSMFGVFEAYYKKNQLSDESQFTISWLGAISVTCVYSGTFVVGSLVDKFGGKIMIYIGSVGIVSALMLTSLCTKLYQFILAQGVLLGVSMAMVFCPSTVYVSQWFKKKSGTAMGIVLSGAAVAGTTLPIAIERLLTYPNLKFEWTMRIVGFIMLPLLAITCVFVRPPPNINANLVDERSPETIVSQQTPKPLAEELEHASMTNKREADFSILRKPVVRLTCLSLFIVYFGMLSPLFYISSYAISKGFSSSLAFYSVSIINAFSFVGRITMGIVSDHYGTFNSITFSTFVAGIVVLCWTTVNSVAGLVIFSIAYGFLEGSIFALQTACATQLSPPHARGVTLGAIMASISLSSLAGTPISGQLAGKYGYLSLSIYSGVSFLLGGVFLAAARMAQDRKLLAVV
ncbi:MFS monocarboxylate transporter [Talaromyces proteolyticus]|uniref:MFS monocarboxylate transporter n=1 Tax=Talaromyces proteolyticus TaxID=1131652 RepID=A0AAD4Q444_9EURO|nr:MFS monocarboxylate transporter [Talaromyces proteolyticus]KAH8702473.1 MFS monocarboxylate transporter [Talaromyces proteolyticus]